MRTGVLAVALVLTSAGLASAQNVIDGYVVKYYAPGAQQPMQQTDTFTFVSAVCNQTAPTSTTSVNPTRLVWDDPINAGKVCLYAVGANGTLFALPVGSYEGTLTAVNSAGNSPESNRAAFSRAAILAAPTGFRIVR